MRLCTILCVLLFVGCGVAHAGDDTARLEAFSQIGFAIAATKACPKVKISPNGMKDLAASLDSEDEVAVFTHSTNVEWATEDAAKSFALAGDRACDIAFDHMKKSKFKLLEPK